MCKSTPYIYINNTFIRKILKIITKRNKQQVTITIQQLPNLLNRIGNRSIVLTLFNA